MSIIATEQDAYDKGKVGVPTTNKMCTKTRASDLGCTISGTYDSNQLVQYTDISRKIPRYEATFIASNGDFNAQYFLIKGSPIAANMRKYILCFGEQSFYFFEGDTYGVNQPAGGGTVQLLHGENCAIWSVDRMSLGSFQTSFNHDAYKSYTISWWQSNS